MDSIIAMKSDDPRDKIFDCAGMAILIFIVAYLIIGFVISIYATYGLYDAFFIDWNGWKEIGHLYLITILIPLLFKPSLFLFIILIFCVAGIIHKMFNDPIAYFLTFTVRGSWRHGDERGSWKRGGQFVPPESDVTSIPNKNLPHYFTEEECHVIKKAVVEVCKERQWTLHEQSVASNHVHVVVTAQDALPERVMQLLKAKATKMLRKAGFVEKEEKIWTQHGSTKYVFNVKGLENVIDYVQNQ